MIKDKKQRKIFDNLLEHYDIKGEKIVFIQHRNLKEFRFFRIERINPTHRIKLYGILKDGNKKKEVSKQLIEAGEIIIGLTTITLNLQILSMYLDTIMLVLSMYFLNCILFYHFGKFKIWGKHIDQLLNYTYEKIKKPTI